MQKSSYLFIDPMIQTSRNAIHFSKLFIVNIFHNYWSQTC